jgi:hypothetical protein
MNRAMENKILQTQEDLKNLLKEQIDFLKASSDAYDKGFKGEAKRMATTIRVLLHDTSSSHSLLGQLNLKSGKFYSTTTKIIVGRDQLQVGSYAGLIGVFCGTGENGYIPNLDSMPHITGDLEFDDYWNEIIFKDNEGNEYSRKYIVLSVANQDGGSHIDPELDEKYAKLSRKNSLGWMTSSDGEKFVLVTGAELAAVRQITHELLHTLIPNYSTKKLPENMNGFVIGGSGIILTKEPYKKFGKVGRNDPCPCESGKKYKHCCGR